MKHEYFEAKQQCLCTGSFGHLEQPVVQRTTRALMYTVWVQTLAAHSLTMCLLNLFNSLGLRFFIHQIRIITVPPILGFYEE